MIDSSESIGFATSIHLKGSKQVPETRIGQYESPFPRVPDQIYLILFVTKDNNY